MKNKLAVTAAVCSVISLLMYIYLETAWGGTKEERAAAGAALIKKGWEECIDKKVALSGKYIPVKAYCLIMIRADGKEVVQVVLEKDVLDAFDESRLEMDRSQLIIRNWRSQP